MTTTLYYNPFSRAAITRWLLEELGIPYELKTMDYEDGSMRSPEFLAINPMGKIPALVDDGHVLTENVAIAIYMADKYKSPHDLAPALHDPIRGPYLSALCWYYNIEAAMTQKSAGFDAPRRQAGWGSYELVLDTLKTRLGAADPYLFGDRFTAADIIIGAGLNFAVMFGLFPKADEYAGYLDRLTARPAFARANPPQ